MDTTTPDRTGSQSITAAVAQRGTETVFVEPLDAYMRLHGWDELAIQRLDLLHIVVLSRATATVMVDGNADVLSPGDALVVPPDVSFGLTCDRAVEGYVLALSLNTAMHIGALSPALQNCLESKTALTLRAPSRRATFQAFDALYADACATGGELSLSVHAALCLAVEQTLDFGDRWDKGESDVSSGSVALVAAFCALVEKDFRQQRSLSEYCSALNTTERALRRATQRQTGQTPLQLVHARCIAEAKRLLRFTNVSVATVGTSLGFEDPAYFNRFFKKAVGESPRAWRVARGDR